MGVEGTAPPEQAAVKQDSKVPAADAAAGAQQSDTLLLDAQIAEGFNNIDVIRYRKKFTLVLRVSCLHANPTAVHVPITDTPLLVQGV